ncbi:MAG TPA: thiamine phosphate synthase [Candidatus Heimdallarchaeota archaeon]|nr:thiamine phosphate synthase [Candidatus Heimdallarchaeota archaeon]
MKKIGRLHIITDIELQDRFSHFELARMAIAGGADTIQFRQKEGSTRKMIEMTRDLKYLCTSAGVTFIVNDRLDVAIASDSDGVHLGQDDFPIHLAREILGENKIIGGSAVTLDEARKCLEEGADYVGFGPVYPTTSKADVGPVTGIDLLKEVIDKVPLPLVAIGGVNADNTQEVIRTGAHGIAVISAVCCQQDPEQATRELFRALKAGM